jgi:methylthioribose-1-phosphate isomerase
VNRHAKFPLFHGELAPVVFRDEGVDLLDQTKLPQRVVVLHITDHRELAAAIRAMKVRGAPAIGIAAAYGFVLGSQHCPRGAKLDAWLDEVTSELRATRPTAVNLFWALDRMKESFRDVQEKSSTEVTVHLLKEAERIHAEDVAANQKMGELGAGLLAENSEVLTHCNAGALATGGYGTALGAIRAGWETGKVRHVFVDETRPLLQGARLTVWELSEAGISYNLITDNAAASLMEKSLVDAVIVGADRIAANGDTANKIGTYGLAVLARHHNVPFYVVAPTSSIDSSTATGEEIPIEERDPAEVREIQGIPITLPTASTLNPAFDVTPHELITAIVTEKGVFTPPFQEGIAGVF